MSNQLTYFICTRGGLISTCTGNIYIVIQYNNNNNNIIIVIIVCGVYKFMYTTVNSMYVHVVLIYLDNCCIVLQRPLQINYYFNND